MDYDTCDETASTLTASTITNTHTQARQPVINIINSNVTIANEPSRNVVYDDNDNLEFIFKEPFGTYGAPPSEGDDIEDDIHLDFGDIIEI